MGSTAIRSALAFPGLASPASSRPRRTRPVRDAADFAALDTPTGVGRDDGRRRRARRLRCRRLHGLRRHPARRGRQRHRAVPAGGQHVVTPSLYSLYDPVRAAGMGRAADRAPRRAARRCSSAGWTRAGATTRSVIAAGLCTRIRTIACQEIFDYSTYDQPHAVQGRAGSAADGRGADDAAAVDPDHGVGRQHPADRPRAGRRSTRSPRSRTARSTNRSTP